MLLIPFLLIAAVFAGSSGSAASKSAAEIGSSASKEVRPVFKTKNLKEARTANENAKILHQESSNDFIKSNAKLIRLSEDYKATERTLVQLNKEKKRISKDISRQKWKKWSPFSSSRQEADTRLARLDSENGHFDNELTTRTAKLNNIHSDLLNAKEAHVTNKERLKETGKYADAVHREYAKKQDKESLKIAAIGLGAVVAATGLGTAWYISNASKRDCFLPNGQPNYHVTNRQACVALWPPQQMQFHMKTSGTF